MNPQTEIKRQEKLKTYAKIVHFNSPIDNCIEKDSFIITSHFKIIYN